MRFSLSIANTVKQLAEKLTLGLTKLNYEDNMEGFFVENLKIGAGQTVSIQNKLTFTPSKYIIMSQEGTGLVTKTGTWSKQTLFLTNNKILLSATTSTVINETHVDDDNDNDPADIANDDSYTNAPDIPVYDAVSTTTNNFSGEVTITVFFTR